MKRLFKTLISTLMVITAFTLAFSGCSLFTSLENDVNVIAVDEDGTEVDTGTVNIFNNWILPEAPSATGSSGLPFLGWSVKEDFVSGTDSNDLLFNAKGVIHYNDVKDYVKDGKVSIYAIYGNRVIVRHYVTVGWYQKTGTSGLDDTLIEKIQSKVKTFLSGIGATAKQLNDVVFRGYDGAISDVGASVNSDGDVDIIIGVGTNLKTQGGIDYIARRTSVTMGDKTGRVIAKLYESAVVDAVYTYMIDNLSIFVN
ncbi:MAG: hypothetical protein SPL13_04580 [Clostridia bacterium]|nr:hypothetical protein [Clostridia bacterium]